MATTSRSLPGTTSGRSGTRRARPHRVPLVQHARVPRAGEHHGADRRDRRGGEDRRGPLPGLGMHITAGIWVNDEESGLKQDLVEWLDELAPPGDYRHHQTGEDNADAHLKRTLIHHQVILPITKGKLDLGPW